MSFSNSQEQGRPVAIKEEGVTLVASVSTLDFVGAGVTGSNIGNDVTETIPGGGSSLTVADIDGTPSVAAVSAIKFTNGSVTDNGDGTVTVTTGAGGGGDVSKVGTPVNNQVAVWTGDGTVEGDAALTFDTTTDVLSSGGLLLTGLTASQLLATDASKNLVSLAVATYPSLTELTYVKGVTSAIQTQLGTKAPSTAPTFATSITGSYLTASEILITDASKNIVSAAVATYPSLTELTYLKGVTSAIQTQLNAKGAGTVTSVAAITLGTTGTDLSSTVATGTTTPVITLQVPTASASNRGALSSTDWSTFNSKAPTTSPTFSTSITGSFLTASEILITDASKNIVSAAVATYPSLTELTYLKGVTSAIQTQLNGKAPSLGADDNYVTDAQLVVISNTSGTNTGDNATNSQYSGLAASKQDTLVSGTNIKTINGASILAAGDLTLLTSLSGAVLTDQTVGQTIGLTGSRLTKLWATDITVTNAITGGVTGNAGTATVLQTARTIGGVSFNGSADITVASATGGFTVSGGNLALGTNSLTMTGSLGATGAGKLTKGWFTDVEITNLPTINGGTLATALSLGTMASETATNYVAKSLFDANTILYATSDNTPLALTVGASTFVGRKAAGDISAMTATEATALLNVFGADSGAGGVKGLAPATVAGDASKFLKGDGTWASIPGGGDALVANPLSQFAATTSLQLAGVISDETGSGALVFANTPTLVTPVLGAATGTSLQLSGLTASEILATDASKNLVSLAVATYPSLTELTYVKGVTSAIQTQLGAKAPTTSPTFATSITGSYLTASEILITDASKNIISAPVATYPSLTELTYLKGVTSAIQTQLNAKAASLGADDNYVTDAEKAALHAAGSDDTFTVANEAADTTCFPLFVTAATGDLGPRTNAGLSFNASTSVLTATGFAGPLTGNVTGNASTATVLATPRTIYGNNFDGSAALTQVIASTYGGTGNGFTKFSGPTTAEKTFTLPDASATLLYSGGALGTPSGGTLTNCTGLPIAGLTASTVTALGVGSIELGHASDTTISRVSAGVVAIEGVNVLTVAGGTLTGNLTFGENTALVHDNALSADGKYTGDIINGTAGAALAFGDLVYLDPTDSRWELVDANAASGADGDARGILGICVLAAAADGNATTILLRGFVRADAAFPAVTVNGPVYASETAGDITHTQPTTTDAVIRVVGFGFDANTIYFNPSSDYITHT